METENKFVYEPPCLEEIESRLLVCLGDSIVPGASQLLPDDEDDW